jgi:type III restriction enzyme
MAKKAVKEELVFPFYEYLNEFYESNKGKIRQSYRHLTKKFLDYNDPDNAGAFLRKPQFRALEIYVFLKEYLNNQKVQTIFTDWFEGNDKFTGRMKNVIHEGSQRTIFEIDAATHKRVFNEMKKFSQQYSNYIFALTMGVGKTILMATCIFYEFLLANRFQEDRKYCHNALVFAPDKTVLQSLKEIMTFDKSKVVPSEYVSWLDANLKFHFLDDSGLTLSVIDKSDYNIIISNTQKIILKKKHTEKSDAQRLFDLDATTNANSLRSRFADIYENSDNIPENEQELTANQRYEKITRLDQLGIYVDEAHHAFGSKLEKDFKDSGTTSLRLTINMLAASLEAVGTHVVACYNYTGTPFVKNRLLPEVVCAYGLRKAIDNKYLKEVTVKGYSHTKSFEFIKAILEEFFQKHKDKRYEGMLPKIAIFATTIDELEKELKLAVEEVLYSLNLSPDIILVNHEGASNDEIREFKLLDTVSSEKQVILLVNKGKEGWNCRSLFSVALHRSPNSKIFVLQATMRCLRSITDIQQTANVYLSDENMKILENELQENFSISLEEFQRKDDTKKVYNIRLVPPPVKVKLKRIKKTYDLKPKELVDGLDFEIEKALSAENTEKYRITETTKNLDRITSTSGLRRDRTEEIKENYQYSDIILISEIAKYLNEKCLKIQNILTNSVDGLDKILKAVNNFNELLYDWIIPRIFNNLYDLIEDDTTEEIEVELVKSPPEDPGYY